MNKKAIFFDLDHTLWDYERNAEEALIELYDTHQLATLGIKSATDFVNAFSQSNAEVWDLYDQNLITQTELRHRRFRMVFDILEIADHSLCDILNDEYLIISPLKPYLIDGALEVLQYLESKYPMHLVTNGFVEIQGQKLDSSNITHFFGEMFTSQRAGAKKPDPKIFEFALAHLGLEKEDVIMIGDNAATDIQGAINAGIDTIYYAPNYTQKHPNATYTIGHLLELKDLF